MTEALLRVEGLETKFITDTVEILAVKELSLHIKEGEILAIVGESGSGKSVLSLSIMGLVPSPPGKVSKGSIYLYDENLLHKSEKAMRKIRGKEIAMIFQEPMTSLNPLFTIGNQMIEGLAIHQAMAKKEAWKQAVDMLELVGLARAEAVMKAYPHQLSGGMRQRVMIAMALICNPKLLIADEPTTALDVTTQSQILQLMKRLNEDLHTAIMLITHDLGIVAEICQRVIVMYAGEVVEEATVDRIFAHPKHPYTQGLLRSVPDIRQKVDRLHSIKGNVPLPTSRSVACAFADRCEQKFDRCLRERPPIYQLPDGQAVRCFLYEGEEVNANGQPIVEGRRTE